MFDPIMDLMTKAKEHQGEQKKIKQRKEEVSCILQLPHLHRSRVSRDMGLRDRRAVITWVFQVHLVTQHIMLTTITRQNNWAT